MQLIQTDILKIIYFKNILERLFVFNTNKS